MPVHYSGTNVLENVQEEALLAQMPGQNVMDLVDDEHSDADGAQDGQHLELLLASGSSSPIRRSQCFENRAIKLAFLRRRAEPESVERVR